MEGLGLIKLGRPMGHDWKIASCIMVSIIYIIIIIIYILDTPRTTYHSQPRFRANSFHATEPSQVGNTAFSPSQSNMIPLPVGEGVPTFGGLLPCDGIFIGGKGFACEDLFKGVFFRQWWECGHL